MEALEKIINAYQPMGKTAAMYSGLINPIPLAPIPEPNYFEPINISKPIDKPYGQHENKLIDGYGITTLYTDFQKEEVVLDLFHNELGNSHHEKENIYDIQIQYKDMF